MPEVVEKGVVTSSMDVTLVTTAETLIVSSGRVPVPLATCRVIIRAWCQLATGAGTTAVTPRIRRGADVAGTLVGESIAENVKAVAGSNEPFSITVSELRENVESVEYSLTLAQAAATGNGIAGQYSIEVEVLNG